jgi:hypothetical protein
MAHPEVVPLRRMLLSGRCSPPTVLGTILPEHVTPSPIRGAIFRLSRWRTALVKHTALFNLDCK